MSPYLAPGVFEDNATYRRRRRHAAGEAVARARRLGLIDALPESRQRVLAARWPEHGQVATLAELAAELGFSRERIRQIENGAIRELEYVLAGWSQREIGLGVARCPVTHEDVARP